MPVVTSGVKAANLRELANKRMEELGAKCLDVRSREVGIQAIHNKIHPSQVFLSPFCMHASTRLLFIGGDQFKPV